jgi:hypothetical protein
VGCAAHPTCRRYLRLGLENDSDDVVSSLNTMYQTRFRPDLKDPVLVSLRAGPCQLTTS